MASDYDRPERSSPAISASIQGRGRLRRETIRRGTENGFFGGCRLRIFVREGRMEDGLQSGGREGDYMRDRGLVEQADWSEAEDKE